jgi:3',5'-cyclic AMP phosphodiesterase CpdA
MGPGGEPQRALARRMCRWRRRHPFNLVVTTGDNVYPGGERSQFDRAFFEPYRCLLRNGVRFRATLGNHDVRTYNGRPELRTPAFGFKARNYVVLRNGVRLVFVDSTRLRPRWLRRHLGPRRGRRWKIVVFHHPVYSPGLEHGPTPGFRRALNPIFRRRGVDLVLNGHDHLYAVTKPIWRIRYVVTGGGGRGLYPCGRAWFSARCVSRYHFTYVRAGRRRITVRAVPIRGRVFHRFTTYGRR